MQMDSEELTEAVLELHEAVRALIGGCQELAGAVAVHQQLLVEIKEAVTAEPQGENPIVALLKRLVELGEANAAALSHILQVVTR